MQRIAAAMNAHSRRLAVFLGSELRRAETRFCPRRNGDSSSTSRSTRRASSSSSRATAAPGGYNSSCKMVGLAFRAISSGQLSSVKRQMLHKYNGFPQGEIDKILVLLHRQESGWIRATGGSAKRGCARNGKKKEGGENDR